MNQLSKILVHSCLQLRQLWFCLALMLAGAGMAMAQTPQAIWTADNTLTFVNSTTQYAADGNFNEQTVTAVWSGTDVTESGTSSPAWSTVSSTLTKVVFDSSFASVRPTSLYSWFSNCSKLTAIKDISNLNTSEVTSMSGMFNNCRALTSLDLSKFNTSNVTDMRDMFNGCSALKSLDLSSFNTSKVTFMSSMFQSCSALKSLNISNFNNSNVTLMRNMFYGCSALTSLDLSNFVTSNAREMSSMFNGCSALKSLDLSNFDTSKVWDMNKMFYGCRALTSLDVSNFNTSNVTNMSSMFNGCSRLTSLDLSNFITSKVAKMSSMFSGCSSLTSLDLSNFDTRKVTNMGTMFNNCSSLTTIFCNDTCKATTSSSNMFYNCNRLVGEYGTAFSTSATDASKANPGEEGYFTLSKEVLTVHDGGDGWNYTTYYNGEHSRFVDNNTEVYVAQADWDNNSIILKLNGDSVKKRLLKGNAFILRSKQPTITLSLCDNDDGAIGGSNDLMGSAKTKDVQDVPLGVIYTLGKVNGVLGFYEYTGNTLNARKAFLFLDGVHSGGTNAPLRFSFSGEDTATGIEASTMDKVQSTGIYDLQGRRVAQPTKGLYIVNGKKVFMK